MSAHTGTRPPDPKLMLRLPRTTLRAGLALALGLGLAGSAAAQPGDPARRGADLGARLDRMGDRLSVTDPQAAALDAIASRPLDDPAASWAAAADVLDVLTDEQLATLRGARAERDGGRRGGADARQGRGRRGGQVGRRPSRPGERARMGARQGRERLTDEQRQAVRSIRDDARQRRQGWVERLRDGSISDAAFVEQSRSLREDSRRRLEAVVPTHAERHARRQAARDAREQALGLTDAQRQQAQARWLDRLRESPEPLDMRPYLDADGRLDRAAFRQAQRERRQAARTTGAERRQEPILTQEQRDLVRVHRLISRGGREGRRR